MPHCCWGVDFQDVFVTQADADGLAAIEAAGIDADLNTGVKPAHGQRFEPSLAVPLLLPPYRYQIVGRYVGKRSPGLDIIGVFHKPAGQ